MNDPLPSLNSLRAFEAAARLGRMTLAGAELSVTHGAISRQVRQLERTLGVDLFEGPKTRLRLTEAGMTLLPYLTDGMERIEAGVRAVVDEAAGLLDVSSMGTFSMRWLIPRLHRFQAAHSDIEVRLGAGDGPPDFTRRDRFDVALRVGTGPWPDDTEVIPLIEEHIGVVMAPVIAERLDPGDVRSIALVPRLETVTRPTAWADWWGRVADSTCDIGGTPHEHFYFMLEAATGGLGACVAPWILVMDDVRAGRLIAPFGWVESGQTYVALRHRERRNRKADRFIAWLMAEAADTAAAPAR